jgi:hypothetical protein
LGWLADLTRAGGAIDSGSMKDSVGEEEP